MILKTLSKLGIEGNFLNLIKTFTKYLPLTLYIMMRN